MLKRALQVSSITLLVATIGIWVATGSHMGWTQTTITEIKRDEITGLDYPVTKDGFIMGLELLGLGIFMSAVEFAVAFMIKDRR